LRCQTVEVIDSEATVKMVVAVLAAEEVPRWSTRWWQGHDDQVSAVLLVVDVVGALVVVDVAGAVLTVKEIGVVVAAKGVGTVAAQQRRSRWLMVCWSRSRCSMLCWLTMWWLLSR
jgi:hypothetical protein